MQDRPEGRTEDLLHEICCLCFPFSPVTLFFTSPYLYLEKAQYKNNNLPRRHAPNGIFIRYTDIYTSTLIVSDQYQKVLSGFNIVFRISWGNSIFWGNDFEPSQRETLQSMESIPGSPRKGESNGQGTKQTDWEVIIHSNSSFSSTPLLFSSSTLTDLEVNLSQHFYEESGNFSRGKKELLSRGENLTLCNKRSLFSPSLHIITSSDASLPSWGVSCQGQTKVSNKCVGALCSQISYNVLHIKEEGYNVGSHPHRQPYDSPVLVNENGGYQMSWKILYMSWKIDPFSQGRGVFQISWAHKFVYAFLPFALIGTVLQKVNQHQCLIIIITSARPGKPWFSGLLKMSVEDVLLP